MAVRHDIGSLGEFLAMQFLSDRGCSLIERNVIVDGGELDLVVDHAGRVVVVEVKTSSNGDDPIEAVSDAKAARVRRGADGYRWVVDRVDVVAVTLDRSGVTIRWLPGAL